MESISRGAWFFCFDVSVKEFCSASVQICSGELGWFTAFIQQYLARSLWLLLWSVMVPNGESVSPRAWIEDENECVCIYCHQSRADIRPTSSFPLELSLSLIWEMWPLPLSSRGWKRVAVRWTQRLKCNNLKHCLHLFFLTSAFSAHKAVLCNYVVKVCGMHVHYFLKRVWLGFMEAENLVFFRKHQSVALRYRTSTCQTLNSPFPPNSSSENIYLLVFLILQDFCSVF